MAVREHINVVVRISLEQGFVFGTVPMRMPRVVRNDVDFWGRATRGGSENAVLR